MDPLSRIAERRIADALARGDLDDYPGKGQPLQLEDLALLDPEVRGAYVLLKGHGYLSEEADLHAQLVSLHTLLAACRDDGERVRLDADRRRLGLRFSVLLERRGVPMDVVERLLDALATRREGDVTSSP